MWYSLIVAMIGSTWDMMIVALVALLLFGNKLPDIMRNLGKGIREFKNEVDSDKRI